MYFVLVSILLLFLAISAVLSYIFMAQVDDTMKAEMLSDIHQYNPNNLLDPITNAWDITQREVYI